MVRWGSRRYSRIVGITQATVVEHLQFVSDDERYKTILNTPWTKLVWLNNGSCYCFGVLKLNICTVGVDALLYSSHVRILLKAI